MLLYRVLYQSVIEAATTATLLRHTRATYYNELNYSAWTQTRMKKRILYCTSKIVECAQSMIIALGKTVIK